MQLNETERLIRNAYTAFNKRDLGMIEQYMHPQVHWPNGWEGGYVEGHRGVRDYWARQWKELDPEVQPLHIRQLEDGRIEVTVQQIVKDLQGKLLNEGQVKHIYTLENGLIKEMVIEPGFGGI